MTEKYAVHLGSGWSPSCFTFNSAPCYCAWKMVDDRPSPWETQKMLWLLPIPVSAFVTIWRGNQWMNYFCISHHLGEPRTPSRCVVWLAGIQGLSHHWLFLRCTSKRTLTGSLINTLDMEYGSLKQWLSPLPCPSFW